MIAHPSLVRSALASGAILAALAYAGPATAQSLFSTGGLGLVQHPQDARGAALGGTTLGLPGPEISWDNPAGAVGLPAAGLRVSFQMDGFHSDFLDRDASSTTARFPLILGAFPFGDRWAVTAGFGSFLDQNWRFEQADTLIVPPDTVAVLDRTSSDGGVSRFRLGGAYRPIPTLAVGAGAEIFTGGTQRLIGRIFPGQVTPSCCTATWQYSGLGAFGSVDWTPNEAVTVALSAAVGGTLEAEVTLGEDEVSDRSFDLPVTLAAGASGRITPSILATVGGRWGRWSSLDDTLLDVGGARDSWALNAGLEGEMFQMLGQRIPVRVGVRTAQLPFRFGGTASEWAEESAVSFGTGLVLGGGAAQLDFSAERGRRGSEAAGLEEGYWRFTLSATALGR